MGCPPLLYRVWKSREEKTVLVLAEEAEAVDKVWRNAALLKIFSCLCFGLSELRQAFTVKKERGKERKRRKEGQVWGLES